MGNKNEKKYKTIRDSVHGYIDIEKEYMDLFVDTPLFQRLGRIEQTSMRVLYPSARHDRFIHSIGTFFLGKKAFQYFKDNFSLENSHEIVSKSEWNLWQKSFEIACLLHDIGHAPFSHTCEGFYKEKKVKSNINGDDSLIVSQLFDELKNKLKKEDYDEFYKDYKGVSPSPHEIVSCIVILRCYSKEIKKLKGDMNLIIRSITGCVFKNVSGKKGIQNCLIRMLNSPVIDVDKLDYITRDSSLTGFSNAIIDSDRLLKAFTAVEENEHDYYPAYNKNALSVIQNVISANNAQQAWMVNHHVVVYNTFLIQAIINKIAKIIYPENPKQFKNELFSVDTIIGKKNCCNVFKVNMLTDDDLWHLFKLYEDDIPEVKELLERCSRKKAVWKSFAEFTLLFDEGKQGNQYKNGDFDLKKFKEAFTACCSDIKEFDGHLFNEKDSDNVSKAGLKFCGLLNEFAIKNDLDPKDFVIIGGSNPTKSKSVISRDKLRIRFFSGENGTKRYDEVMKLARIEDFNNKEGIGATPYFYIFHSKLIDKEKLCEFIKKSELFKYQESI